MNKFTSRQIVEKFKSHGCRIIKNEAYEAIVESRAHDGNEVVEIHLYFVELPDLLRVDMQRFSGCPFYFNNIIATVFDMDECPPLFRPPPLHSWNRTKMKNALTSIPTHAASPESVSGADVLSLLGKGGSVSNANTWE